MDVAHALLIAAGSLSMGVLGGLLGVGGGVFLVPWLVAVGGVSAKGAIGVSLFCVIGTSAAASFIAGRDGGARLDVSLLLEPFLVVGAVIASAAAGRLEDRALLLGFAALVVVIAALVLARGRFAETPRPTGAPLQRAPLVAALALFSGAASGLFGVGGGVLVVPALVLAGRMPLKEAASTSSLCLMTSAAAGAAVHLRAGYVPAGVVTLALVGVLPGGILGARMQRRVPERVLEILFLLLALAVAALTAIQGMSR